MVKNMNRIDTNAVMLKCFSIKQNVSTGLYAVINMIETYEQRSSETILRERAAGVYNKAKYDDWIRASIVIFKRDIRDAIATLNVMIRDKEVTSSALWFIVNQTAKKAMENGIKWVHYLTQNSLIKDLQYRGSIPIDQWLLNAGLGFDESAYKKELDRAKDSDSNKKANRSAVSTIANFVQGLKNGMNSEKSFTTKGNRRLRAKAKGSFSFKKAKGEVETLLQSILPNATWDNRYCVFYHHPTATCRHDNKCKRKHECPSCDLEHKLEDCPDKVKQQ